MWHHAEKVQFFNLATPLLLQKSWLWVCRSDHLLTQCLHRSDNFLTLPLQTVRSPLSQQIYQDMNQERLDCEGGGNCQVEQMTSWLLQPRTLGLIVGVHRKVLSGRIICQLLATFIHVLNLLCFTLSFPAQNYLCRNNLLPKVLPNNIKMCCLSYSTREKKLQQCHHVLNMLSMLRRLLVQPPCVTAKGNNNINVEEYIYSQISTLPPVYGKVRRLTPV